MNDMLDEITDEMRDELSEQAHRLVNYLELVRKSVLGRL